MINIIVGGNGAGKSVFLKRLHKEKHELNFISFYLDGDLCENIIINYDTNITKEQNLLKYFSSKIVDLSSINSIDSKEINRLLSEIVYDIMKPKDGYEHIRAEGERSITNIMSSGNKRFEFFSKDIDMLMKFDKSLELLPKYRDKPKKYIFIDDIEAFSEPSRINIFNKLIHELNKNDWTIWLTTHNPKVLKSFTPFADDGQEQIKLYYLKSNNYSSPFDGYTKVMLIENMEDYLEDHLIDLKCNIKEDVEKILKENIYNVEGSDVLEIINYINEDNKFLCTYINYLYFRSLSKIVVEKEITLVEGATDAIFYSLNENNNKWYDEYIECGGKLNILFIMNFCNSIGIKYTVIIDRDYFLDSHLEKELNKDTKSIIKTFKLNIDDKKVNDEEHVKEEAIEKNRKNKEKWEGINQYIKQKAELYGMEVKFHELDLENEMSVNKVFKRNKVLDLFIHLNKK